jgi:tRNA-splicing ligase RtcB (3'-phosphate/5'-hydroxy nucleic acid ligase)
VKQFIHEEGSRPVRIWTEDIDDGALRQLKNVAKLPFIHKHGVVAMPDVHWGIGATVGSVVATKGAIIPAAVGVDIGCGMNAIRTSLKASDLPDGLAAIRRAIERDVPLGAGGAHVSEQRLDRNFKRLPQADLRDIILGPTGEKGTRRAAAQLGTLGSGNHFIEVCLDEGQDVWIMLHSGSRGTGNIIGRHYIERAKRLMERYFIALPDADLAYFPEDSAEFEEYVAAVGWCQDYAAENRRAMMEEVVSNLRAHIPKPFEITHEAINCHHNYVERENHFGENLWVTRKGAIRARESDLGIIPGSMGARSYIVRGKGSAESYHSCAHGAGRKYGRREARRRFTVADLEAQTQDVECRKDAEVLDELPSAYKPIDDVMANQADLVEIVHTLKQVLCVKGA